MRPAATMPRGMRKRGMAPVYGPVPPRLNRPISCRPIPVDCRGASFQVCRDPPGRLLRGLGRLHAARPRMDLLHDRGGRHRAGRGVPVLQRPAHRRRQ
ncbi:hypothetical protein ACFFX0_12035 [Citricoccus parietis]|uniref:Uncharacterized protein n=1 Tax=Citricoccus parietis TaxID=592307 RepID=A0ABV5FYY1_9MICC